MGGQARKPKPVRELRAMMEIKELSLKDVSELANVEYTTVSSVLNGRVFYRAAFGKIRRAIENAQEPIDHFPDSLMKELL